MHGEIASTPADVAMEGAIPGPWRERIEAAGRAVWGAVWGKGRGVAAILVVLFVAIRVADPAPIEVLRHKTFDLMQQMLPANTKPPLVMVAAIDEKSLAELGQWPWSRRTLAQLIVKLRRMGAIAIGFDVVFAEPDRTSPGYLAERTPGLGKKAVEELRKLPSNDSVFAGSFPASRWCWGYSRKSAALSGTERTRFWRNWPFPRSGRIRDRRSAISAS